MEGSHIAHGTKTLSICLAGTYGWLPEHLQSPAPEIYALQNGMIWQVAKVSDHELAGRCLHTQESVILTLGVTAMASVWPRGEPTLPRRFSVLSLSIPR